MCGTVVMCLELYLSMFTPHCVYYVSYNEEFFTHKGCSVCVAHGVYTLSYYSSIENLAESLKGDPVNTVRNLSIVATL